MNGICHFIVKHGRWLAVFLLLTSIVPAMHLRKVKVDNSIDVWLDHDSKEYKNYQSFRGKYGNDEWILIAFESADQHDAGEFPRLCAKLSSLDAVKYVFSPLTPEDQMPVGADAILMSADGATQAVLLYLNDLHLSEQKRQVIEQVHALLTENNSTVQYCLAGPTVMNASLDRLSGQQAKRLIPIALLVTCFGLYFVFRSFGFVFIAVFTSGFSVLWAMGFAIQQGMTMNMITTVLPVLLWVLSLTGCIHIVYHFQLHREKGLSVSESARMALLDIIKPYGIASLTTAAGMLSLMSSHMVPVKELGVFASAGIMIIFIGNLVMVPTLLVLIGFRLKRKTQSEKLENQFPDWIWHKRYVISAIMIIVLIMPLLFLSRFKIESNILEFFQSDSRVVTDNAFISHRLTGLSTVEMDVRCAIRDRDDYVGKIAQSLDGAGDYHLMISSSETSLRITAFVKTMESHAFNELIRHIKNNFMAFGIDDDITITGSIALLNSVQSELIRTQIRSVCMAFCVVAVILILLFRSFLHVVTGLLVNAFPLACIIFAMELGSIPLNSATVMISSIALGIAVDDTAFFLVKLKSEVRRWPSMKDAIQSTWRHVATPISQSSLIVSMGFLVLTISTFKPIAFFGLLGVVAMAMAWLGDVVVLPAILLACSVKRREMSL